MLVTELVVVRLEFVVEVDRIDEDVTVRDWACGRVARPITGGETVVGVGFGEALAGLSQEEKKSSSSLLAALVSAEDVISGMPST